jgi:hypothetical protein
MKRRFGIALAGVLVAAAAVTTTAGSGFTAANAAREVDWSSSGSVKSYLTSIGINPKGVAIQRGKRLYAGSDCPGRSWSCTSATRVVQVAQAGGQTRFECSPSTPAGDLPAGFPPTGFPSGEGATSDPTACVIVQANTTGDNVARCVERSTEPDVTLQCSIAQINEDGDNHAFIDQDVSSATGTTQDAELIGEVLQTNADGGNFLHSSQAIHDQIKQHGGFVDHDQDADVELAVDQRSDNGRQAAHVHQAVHLQEFANGPVTGGAQTQLSDLDGSVHQNSVDVSEATVRQHELLDQNAPEGTVDQFQSGPLDCCTDQFSNPGNHFNIDQSSNLHASEDDAYQTTFLSASCTTSGICDADQHAKTNGDQARNSCRGSSCFITVFCTTLGGEDGGESTDPCFINEGGGEGAILRLLYGRLARW